MVGGRVGVAVGVGEADGVAVAAGVAVGNSRDETGKLQLVAISAIMIHITMFLRIKALYRIIWNVSIL